MTRCEFSGDGHISKVLREKSNWTFGSFSWTPDFGNIPLQAMGLEHGFRDGGVKTQLPETSDAGNDIESVEPSAVACDENVILQQPLLQGGVDAGSRERLASLDVFRGLTIAVMILVDDAGGLWPAINHSPWDNLTLADFVMPFFLFIVGVAMALTYKRVQNKVAATRKALLRSLKLFALGILLQGGYYHGINDLTYGVDILSLRWSGILQRIALAYLVVALCEIWLVRKPVAPRNFLDVFDSYSCHWVVYLAVIIIYLALMYGLYVPDWTFQTTDLVASQLLTVRCGVRGDVGPACNAVGYIDRLVLGSNHLYHNPVYKRTKACSINSPDYGPQPPNAPAWCQAPFDPEGLLSSFSAIGSCFIGLHYGHVLVHFRGHKARIWQWTAPALGLVAFGAILHFLGMPLNKPLYSFSYVLLTAGAAGLVFSSLYVLVDVYGWRKPTLLLEWMGMNSLLIYVLAACGVIVAFLQGFYWGTPENNLVSLVERDFFQTTFPSQRSAKLAYVLFEVVCWCAVAGVLRNHDILWKL